MIDETDLKIIGELKKDGRASFSDIADELGIATSTVTGRFQKLEEEGIITGFSPKIDYEELGFELTAMINIRAESGRIPEVAEELKTKERVISFFEVTGETDMVLISRFIDREDMNSFLKELQETSGIKSTETNIILTTPKLEDNMDLEGLMEHRI
ncbi:MAG: Lrp/AsnC family transcriptional regulator [Candidatus Nanohalobium sp.]